MAVDDNDEAVIAALRASHSNIVSILRASARMDKGLAAVDARLSLGLDSLDAVTEAVAPLQSQAMATKALHARINRAVPPAVSLLRSFALVESLQRRLLRLSSRISSLPRLLDFVDCVDRLRETIAAVTAGCEPAVLLLFELDPGYEFQDGRERERERERNGGGGRRLRVLAPAPSLFWFWSWFSFPHIAPVPAGPSGRKIGGLEMDFLEGGDSFNFLLSVSSP